MSGFQEALKVALDHEGGVSDHPDDPGGLTLQGITQTTYDQWRDAQGLERRPVTQSTDGERREIYRREYWLAGRCNRMPWPLSLVHFDSMIQHGRAPWLLQLALAFHHPDLEVDGVVGPDTLEAANATPPEEAAEALLRERLRYYAHLMTDEGADDPHKAFAGGWTRRVADLWERVERDT